MQGKIENWQIDGKKRRVLVVRDKGRIKRSLVLQKQTQAQVERLISRFKRTGSFNQNVTSIEKYKNGQRRISTKEKPTRDIRTQLVAKVNMIRTTPQGRMIGQPKIFYGFSDLGFIDSQTGQKRSLEWWKEKCVGNAIKQATSMGWAYDRIKIISIRYSYTTWQLQGESSRQLELSSLPQT